MVRATLVAVKSVVGIGELDRREILAGLPEGGVNRIALLEGNIMVLAAPIEQHGAVLERNFFRVVGSDGAAIIRDRRFERQEGVGLKSHVSAEAEADRAGGTGIAFRAGAEPLVGGANVCFELGLGEFHFFRPSFFHLCIGELEAGGRTMEELRRHRHKSRLGEPQGHILHMVVHAENFLENDHRGAVFGIYGRGEKGPHLAAVGNRNIVETCLDRTHGNLLRNGLAALYTRFRFAASGFTFARPSAEKLWKPRVRGRRNRMRFCRLLPLFLICLSSLPASAADPVNYCVGIRGNGENAPAHWPSLARLVEENGMPKAMAGSSSGSVSMFFMDSLAGNSAINAEKDPEKKRRMQAVLLKSLPQFADTMAHTDKIASAWNLSKQLGSSGSPISDGLKSIFSGKGPLKAADVEQIYGKYAVLANPELLRGIESNPSYFKGEAGQALSVFGKFDATKDDKLFFRPGLVDFKSFAVVLGEIADFYAGNTDEDTQNRLAAFAGDCADSGYGKQWKDISPDCNQKFQRIVSDYLNKGQFQHKALFNQVGTNIPAFPSTALVKGDGLKAYNAEKAAYLKGEDRQYADFSVDFNKDLAFGYWGSEENLAKIDKGLDKFRAEGDLKSQKFQAAGQANWFEVLSVSPAEPGLANLQRIPTGTTRGQVVLEMQKPFSTRWNSLVYRDDAISAGGWSDLHPTLVLKAAGCEHVAYITRQGGDAKFGQQVFLRLTGEASKVPFWTHLEDNNARGWSVAGTPAADTNWNKIYNLGNHDSSYQRSLRAADAVYCTNWDSYNMFQEQMWPMVEQAYTSPVFLGPGAAKGLGVNPPDNAPNAASLYPGCIPYRRQGGGEDKAEQHESPAL
jgi:hypothetical protein